ncbi:dihydrodipicolinate synthase family protein [Streptomyces olivaceus]|uniref:dihydrodipicolinate synthase family protein n=2 Tax=Streptomyces olivaceus TaxID=47716 RepID=UPI001CCBBEB5|nr:dihydrodipicolinate synthase family protein [Streptomyces olivaceus]MBZ6284355.1 dihydrodipicolinate synthase family protein [Streptomyces olivaceus]MBZ6295615.1 dihydrodipicolinate synthase family protein [Streptomyces olivaceus]MBZ6327612.1 dihydrodipicolinate synthase family protein [Streptomyces olivaceus]
MKDVQLGGMISTVVTPFDENDQVNLDLLRGEVKYLLDQGVTAICACGSTGEGQALSLEESVAICATVVDEVDGRVPVIGGVIQNSTAQAKRYSLALKEAGVDALQVTPVHYVFAPSPEETVAHYREIGEATDLPIVLYNVVPWALVPVDTIELLRDVPQVTAIKQSGGDIHLLADLLHRMRDRFTVLAALDDLHYPAFVMGAHGALAAIPTVTPRLSVELWDAVQAGDHTKALELHERILTVWRAIDAPNLPATLKAALELQGRSPGLPRRPFRPATDAERERIRTALEAARLI